jgi:flagellin-specific chaperone FliS
VTMAKMFSSIDNERVKHINYLMDGLYDRLSELYEALVDRELEESKDTITSIIKELKSLQDSMEDDL